MDTTVLATQPLELAISPANTIPVNGLALLQHIGALDDADTTEVIEIVLHETAKPIQLTTRQVQIAMLNPEALANLHAQIDDEAKAVAASATTMSKKDLAVLKTLAVNVTRAKTTILNIEAAVKKQLDASIELTTTTKKSIIANIKAVSSAIDGTRDTVRAPLTAVEEAEKARKQQIEGLLAELTAMVNVWDPKSGTYTPSLEIEKRIDRLKTLIPAHLASEPKLLAKFQDVEKQLPDMAAIARMQERKDADAIAAIEAAKKAEAKAEAAKEMLSDAIGAGANIANTLAQQQTAAIAVVQEVVQPVQTPPPAASAQLFTLEQRKEMAAVWMQKAAEAGFTSDVEIAKVKRFFNMINKGQVPYLQITGDA